MLSINGYYNGKEFVLLDNSCPKPNQKVIITLLDEYVVDRADKPYRKYVGKLSSDSAQEILSALEDCN